MKSKLREMIDHVINGDHDKAELAFKEAATAKAKFVLNGSKDAEDEDCDDDKDTSDNKFKKFKKGDGKNAKVASKKED